MGLLEHTFSRRAVINRFSSNKGFKIKMMNYFRANTQGKRHIRYYEKVIEMLEKDPKFRAFFEQDTTEVPTFYRDKILNTLGPLAEWLPEGGLQHDAYAYLNAVDSGSDELYQTSGVT